VLDFHWIRDDLALGARFPMELATRLAREHGVRGVVDVRIECCDDAQVLGACGIELLHLPTVDGDAVALEMIERGVRWVRQHLERREAVLVHCEHGVGRSSLVAACILVDLGSKPIEAVATLKRRRPVVAWSRVQQQRFAEWCAVRADSDVPAVGEIERIMWDGLG
jgi:Cyclin-dependent kinase inhibitor 3 (CDKN3)